MNKKEGIISALISIVLGCLLALIVCCVLSNQMSSVNKKDEANAYISAGSVNITAREDQFINITESRVKIEKSSGSSGGTTIDSSGFSGKSGKF